MTLRYRCYNPEEVEMRFNGRPLHHIPIALPPADWCLDPRNLGAMRLHRRRMYAAVAAYLHHWGQVAGCHATDDYLRACAHLRIAQGFLEAAAKHRDRADALRYQFRIERRDMRMPFGIWPAVIP